MSILSGHVQASVIRRLTNNLWAATLASAGCEQGKWMYSRMKNPRLGDIVVEISTFGMKGRPDLDGVGILLESRRDPIKIEEWDVGEDGPIPDEQVYIIMTFDGRKFRWTNATMVAALLEQLP